MQYDVSFLGMYLKPWRVTVSRDSLWRMQGKLTDLQQQRYAARIPATRLATILASFRGILAHGYNKRTTRNFEI